MAIALIVEDGSNVAGANTYASEATVTEYALNRGIALDATKVAIKLVIAMDYLSTFADKWVGFPTYPDQALAWPRRGFYIGGQRQPDNVIPGNLIAALGQLVIEQHNGVVLFPVDTKAEFIVREKLDVIETQYSEAVRLAYLNAGGLLPTMPFVDALLAPLLSGGGFTLRTRRV